MQYNLPQRSHIKCTLHLHCMSKYRGLPCFTVFYSKYNAPLCVFIWPWQTLVLFILPFQSKSTLLCNNLNIKVGPESKMSATLLLSMHNFLHVIPHMYQSIVAHTSLPDMNVVSDHGGASKYGRCPLYAIYMSIVVVVISCCLQVKNVLW